MSEASEVIDILLKNGWCKDAVEDFEGRYCLVGAFWHVPFSFKRWSEFSEKFYSILQSRPEWKERCENADASSGSIYFNNHPDTTLEDMILVLKIMDEEI